jgi:AraC-like DNA-binding protein
MGDPATDDGDDLGDLPRDGTVAAAVTARLIQHAAERGVPMRDLLDRVGWPSPTPPGPDARVPFQAHWSVWGCVHEHGVPGDFGLSFGDSFELDQLGVLGMLMTHSATVEEAMEQQIRFQRLLIDVPFKVTRIEPEKLVIEHPLLPIATRLPHMIVAGLAYWMRLFRALLQADVSALCVELPHPPLASPALYRATFGTLPRFDAPRILVELDRSFWRTPVRAAPLGVEAYLRTRAAALLCQLPRRGDRLDAVREYIAEELRHARRPTLTGAARRMGASTRTLQRALRAAEMSYDTLLDETRRRLSIEYLGDDRLSIGEVAVVVGYSEPATFYRAFKRWTGVPPGAYRRSAPALPARR